MMAVSTEPADKSGRRRTARDKEKLYSEVPL